MAIGEKTKLYEHRTIETEKAAYKLISDFIERPVSELVQSEHFILYNVEQIAVDSGDWEKPGYKHLQQRRKRAYHKAKAGPVLELHLHHLLSQEFDFSEQAKRRLEFLVDESLGDATGQDEPFSEWLDYATRWAIAHGLIATIVDGPPADPNMTEAERRNARQQPHFVTYRADELINWDRFTTGEYNGMFNLFIVVAPSRKTAEGKAIKRRFRWMVPDDSQTYVKQTLEQDGDSWKVVDEQFGALPYVPVNIYGKGLAKSWLLRTAELEKASFNLGSAMSNTIYQQCFKTNFITGAKEDEIQGMNESSVVLLKNPDAKVFQLDEGKPEAAIDEEEKVSRTALDLGMMKSNRVVDGSQVESAESKEKDMMARERAYNRFCNVWERHVNKLLYFAALIDGAQEAEAEQMTFSIPRDFGLTSFEHDTIRSSLLRAIARETQNKELYDALAKTLVSRYKFVTDSGNATELRERLYRAIEAAELQQTTFSPFVADTAAEALDE